MTSRTQVLCSYLRSEQRVWKACAVICISESELNEPNELKLPCLFIEPAGAKFSCAREASSGGMKSRKLQPFKLAPGEFFLASAEKHVEWVALLM